MNETEFDILIGMHYHYSFRNNLLPSWVFSKHNIFENVFYYS